MAHTLFEAAKTSQNPLAAGVLKAIATSDELTAMMPFVPTRGSAWNYSREKALPSADFISRDHTSIPESSATFEKVDVSMRTVISDVDVYVQAEQQQSELQSQRSVQTNKKLKALGRTLGQKFITGVYAGTPTIDIAISGVTIVSVGPNQDTELSGPGTLFYDQSADELFYRGPGDRDYGPAQDVSSDGTFTLESDNPSKKITVTVVNGSLPGGDASGNITIPSSTEEFDGLQTLCPASRTVASTGTNGDAYSYEVLDQLMGMLKSWENPVFIMNDALKRKHMALDRALGGATPQDMVLPGIGKRVPVYRDVPIIRSDWVPSTESKGGSSTLSSVYLVDLDPAEGFYCGAGQARPAADVDIDPRVARVRGVQIFDLGILQSGKHAYRTRIDFLGATALGSELAVARASEIETV